MNNYITDHGSTNCYISHPGMAHWEWELLHGEEADPTPASTVDEVFKKYAAEIDRMYVNRTRGDYSSIGILSEFARALKEAEGR